MRYRVEVQYRNENKFAVEVQAFESAMREAMVHGGLSYDEAVWYVSTTMREAK